MAEQEKPNTHRVIATGDDARRALKQGIDLVADTIKQTLGPKGRNVIVKSIGPLAPRSFNDGYYVAKEISHDDPFVRAGADMVIEICKKTNDLAGDGTTTTAVLAQAMIAKAFERMKKRRFKKSENPVDLKREIEQDAKELVEYLKKISIPVDSAEQVRNLATISANNDDDIGNAIAEIYEKVGKHATMMVEKSAESKIRTEVVKGVYFDKGWTVPAFVNNVARMRCEYESARVVVTEEKLSYFEDVVPIFEQVAEAKKNGEKVDRLVIIADDFGDEVTSSLALTNKNYILGRVNKDGSPAGFPLLCVKAPEYGPTRQEILGDIAVYCGAKLIGNATGSAVKDISYKDFGAVEKVIATSKSTTMTGGGGTKEAVDERIASIRGQIEQTLPREKTTREKFEKRLGVLAAGVGIIHAGAPTEIESKERHARVEDAVLATMSAIEEGICVGGGLTFWKLATVAKSDIMRHACDIIAWQVAENAGEDGDSVVSRLGFEYGWNARTGKFGNLLEQGVVDATKVVRISLQNAASMVALFLTTASIIVEETYEQHKVRTSRK